MEEFFAIEMDGGLVEDPGRRKPANELEGGSSKGFVESVSKLKADVFIGEKENWPQDN